MDNRLNKLMNDHIFKHFYMRTYHNDDYKAFRGFSDQKKVGFLIELFLFCSNANCERSSFEAQFNSFKAVYGRDSIEKAEEAKDKLGMIIQRHQLPKAELFYQEMPFKVKSSNWRINYEHHLKEECDDVIQYEDSSIKYLFDECYEVWMNMTLPLVKSMRNDIEMIEYIHPIPKSTMTSINYSKLTRDFTQSHLHYSFLKEKNKRAVGPNESLKAKGASQHFNFSLKKKRTSDCNYWIMNRSYAESASLCTESSKALSKILNCPVNSHITLDHNEALCIQQVIQDLSHSSRVTPQIELIENADHIQLNASPTALKQSFSKLMCEIDLLYNHTNDSLPNDDALYQAISLDIKRNYQLLAL